MSDGPLGRPAADGRLRLSLLERIRAEIVASGPMPFEQFMELALYDPADGFYGSGPLRSKYKHQRGPMPSRYWENFDD